MTRVLERYEHAAQASAIIIDPNHGTSADLLLASGMAQAGSLRNRAAIALYRLRLKVTAVDTHEISAWAVAAAVRHYGRAPHNLHPAAASKVFEIVLHWFLEGVCSHCEGRRFELVPGTQLVSTHRCHVCHGVGKEPVANRLHRKHRDAGRWMADSFGDMISHVESDMAARLRG